MDLGWGRSLQGHPKLLCLIATIMPSSLQGAFMENGATAPQDWCHCTLDYKRAKEICPAAHSEPKCIHIPVILSWMWQGMFSIVLKLHACLKALHLSSVLADWKVYLCKICKKNCSFELDIFNKKNLSKLFTHELHWMIYSQVKLNNSFRMNGNVKKYIVCLF